MGHYFLDTQYITFTGLFEKIGNVFRFSLRLLRMFIFVFLIYNIPKPKRNPPK